MTNFPTQDAENKYVVYLRRLKAVTEAEKTAMAQHYRTLVFAGFMSDDVQRIIATAIADILISEYDTAEMRINSLKAITHHIEQAICAAPDRE